MAKKCTYKCGCLYKEFSRYDYCNSCSYWIEQNTQVPKVVPPEDKDGE